jgi:predicted MFS family arabinose efflux permease
MSEFKRDRFFWTIALQTFVVNMFLGGFGPAQPLLRADQGTSLAVAGLHGTAMGIASIIAGLATPHIAHRFGRTNGGWIGLIFFSIGITTFIIFKPIQITLVAALITGFGVSTVINSYVTSMNHHFGKLSPLAIAQANGISSAGYVLGTSLVGTIATYAREFWRLGMAIAVPMAFLLYLTSRTVTQSDHTPDASGPQSGKLSGKYWLAWLGFVFSIGTEFATAFWAAALVQDRTGAKAAIATTAIVSLGVGMGIGRWYGGKVLHRLSLDHQLLTVLTLQLTGFAILWLSHNMVVSLVALLINGLGISMQFPLQSMRMISHSDNRPDLAIGRSSLAAGLAIGGAPFMLGILGDNIGISRAYMMVPAFIFIAMILVKLSPAKVAQELLDELEL